MKLCEMHCHIIPGVDDGSKDSQTSIQMVHEYYKQGVRTIICTPHYRPGYYATDKSIIDQQFIALQQAVMNEHFEEEVRLFQGCEVHDVSDAIDKLNSNQIYTMANSDYVLIEFRTNTDLQRMRDTIYNLQAAGYKAIVAHAERYKTLYDHWEYIETLVDMGAYIQLNAENIIGENGWGMKRYCKKLLKEGLISFVGSDAHDMKQRRPRMDEAEKTLMKIGGKELCYEILCKNPEFILRNQEI